MPNYNPKEAIAASTTHGMKGTPTYVSWIAARGRCRNPNDPAYGRYGGKGITFCERWDSFENFLADMGLRPDNMTLDREDNDKGYEPGNCRWATRVEQQNNKSTNRILTVDGVSKTAAEWAREKCLNPATINSRLHKGWSDKDAVMIPIIEKKGKRRESLSS